MLRLRALPRLHLLFQRRERLLLQEGLLRQVRPKVSRVQGGLRAGPHVHKAGGGILLPPELRGLLRLQDLSRLGLQREGQRERRTAVLRRSRLHVSDEDDPAAAQLGVDLLVRQLHLVGERLGHRERLERQQPDGRRRRQESLLQRRRGLRLGQERQGEQAKGPEDDHQSETAGSLEERVLPVAEAHEADEGAARQGDRAADESHSGLVPEQEKQGEATPPDEVHGPGPVSTAQRKEARHEGLPSRHGRPQILLSPQRNRLRRLPSQLRRLPLPPKRSRVHQLPSRRQLFLHGERPPDEPRAAPPPPPRPPPPVRRGPPPERLPLSASPPPGLPQQGARRPRLQRRLSRQQRQGWQRRPRLRRVHLPNRTVFPLATFESGIFVHTAGHNHPIKFL